MTPEQYLKKLKTYKHQRSTDRKDKSTRFTRFGRANKFAVTWYMKFKILPLVFAIYCEIFWFLTLSTDIRGIIFSLSIVKSLCENVFNIK